MNLNEGENHVIFIANCPIQGTSEISGYIYYYKQDIKLVISDVDGTITKSDILG